MAAATVAPSPTTNDLFRDDERNQETDRLLSFASSTEESHDFSSVQSYYTPTIRPDNEPTEAAYQSNLKENHNNLSQAPIWHSFSSATTIDPQTSVRSSTRVETRLWWPLSTIREWSSSLVSSLDRNALAFGTRMSVSITVASLFVLIGGDQGVEYPQGMWVIITVLFVCWFPSLDAASVVEKSLQRIYGTLIGASVGVLCGVASVYFCGLHKNGQAIFVGTCIASYTFVLCWAALQYPVQALPGAPPTPSTTTTTTGPKIIARYNYACILSLLTFYICILPFYSDSNSEARWTKALYRILNVLIGCLMGAALSIFILPRSTVQILQRKIQLQIQLAGQASQAVLYHAADHFSESAYVPLALAEELMLESIRTTSSTTSVRQQQQQQQQRSFRTKLTASHRPWRNHNQDEEEDGSPYRAFSTATAAAAAVVIGRADEALMTQEKAIQESRLIQAQLNMLSYDPFQFTAPDHVVAKFRTEVAHTLARALRIQHTVVLIDGIVRNDPKHDFGEAHIGLFATVGTLIGKMLSVPLDQEAAQELQSKMVQIRRSIVELASVVSTSSLEDVTAAPEESSMEKGDDVMRVVGSRHNMQTLLLNDHEEEEPKDTGKERWHEASNVLLNEKEATTTTRTGDVVDDMGGKGAPKLVRGSRVCALLFLQLVEHLAFRSIRLYESWKYCELLYQAATTTTLQDQSMDDPTNRAHRHRSVRQLHTLHQQSRLAKQGMHG